MACLFSEITEPTDPQELERMRNALAQRDYKASPANTHKIAARSELLKAISCSDAARPEHSRQCGTACQPEAQHGDYSRPLDAEWLCHSCHIRLHHSTSDVLPGQMRLSFGGGGEK